MSREGPSAAPVMPKAGQAEDRAWGALTLMLSLFCPFLWVSPAPSAPLSSPYPRKEG